MSWLHQSWEPYSWSSSAPWWSWPPGGQKTIDLSWPVSSLSLCHLQSNYRSSCSHQDCLLPSGSAIKFWRHLIQKKIIWYLPNRVSMFSSCSSGLVTRFIGWTDHVVDSHIAVTEANYNHAWVVGVNVTTEDVSTAAANVLRIRWVLQGEQTKESFLSFLVKVIGSIGYCK